MSSSVSTSLSRPARREHIHTRDIRCRGFRREDGLWDIEVTLEDTKTYSFDNRDPPHAPAPDRQR